MAGRWLLKVLVVAFLGPCVAAISAEKAKAQPIKCAPLVLAEYCFPGGDLSSLVSVDQIMEHGIARAQTLISERDTPSQIPPHREAELTQMWQRAVQQVYDYAQAHSYRLDNLTVPAPAPEARGAATPVMSALNLGPPIRLNFVATKGDAFRFDGQVLINQNRLLHFMRGAAQSGGNLLGPYGQVLSFLLMSAPANNGFISLSAVFQNPLTRSVFAPFRRAAAASDVSFMGSLGMEMVLALSMAVEDAIRARSIALTPALHLYRDGSETARDMDSPQVVWSGHLLLSDEALSRFSENELELLLTHEAMHLMRPNIFLGFSAADRIQRQFFPELNTERTATLFNNFMGRASPGKPTNCPIELAEDDELFTDYYVFYFYRDQPDKQQQYLALLKRIHQEFNPGSYSQAAFRVEFAELVMQDFAQPGRRNKETEHQNRLFIRAMIDAAIANLPRYLNGAPVRFDDMLQQMEQHSDIALEARQLRTLINYYRRKALLKEGWETNNSRFTVSCDDVEQMFQMTPAHLTRD